MAFLNFDQISPIRLPADPVRLFWEEGSASYVLPFDSCTLETHRFQNNVTSHPVENGAEITDHTIVQPDEISLTGVFSDTPLLSLQNAFSGSSALSTTQVIGDNPFQSDRGREFYSVLKKLRDEATIVQVLTTLQIYDSMLITSLTVPRDAARGGGVFVEMSLKRVTLVNSETGLGSGSGIGSANGATGATKVGGKQSPLSANASQSELASGVLRVGLA